MRTDVFPPRHCQNTGGYAWQVAEFAAAQAEVGGGPWSLCSATPTTLDSDTVWPEFLTDDTVLRLDHRVRHGTLPAGLYSDATGSVCVVVNPDAGSFVELVPEVAIALRRGVEVGSLGATLWCTGLPAPSGFAAVTLVRHGLVSADRPVTARSAPGSLWTEPSTDIVTVDGLRCAVNRLTGRVLRVDTEAADLMERARSGMRTGQDVVYQAAPLTAAGLLRVGS